MYRCRCTPDTSTPGHLSVHPWPGRLSAPAGRSAAASAWASQRVRPGHGHHLCGASTTRPPGWPASHPPLSGCWNLWNISRASTNQPILRAIRLSSTKAKTHQCSAQVLFAYFSFGRICIFPIIYLWPFCRNFFKTIVGCSEDSSKETCPTRGHFGQDAAQMPFLIQVSVKIHQDL